MQFKKPSKTKKLTKTSPHILSQCLLTTIGITIGISAGGIFGFSSIFFKQIKEQSINITISKESWIASAPTILLFPVCLSSSLLVEKIGRKSALIFSELLTIMTWITVHFAINYPMFLTSRIITGIHMAIVYPTFITFTGELSIPKYRNICLTTMSVGGPFGTFLVQFLGEYLHWRYLALIFIIFPLYGIIILLYLKDSYVTWLDRNNISKAHEIFVWYRGNSPETTQEYDDIILDKRKRKRDSLREILRMCMKKSFLFPFGITTLVYLTNEITGNQAMVFYTSKIIDMINNDENVAFYATLALNILRILATILSIFFVRLSNVRFILISSGYCLAVTLILLGLFIYLSEAYVNREMFSILALCALVMNTFFYGLGLGPLPCVVCGEMFPESTRSIGGPLSSSISFLFLFVAVKFMPEIVSSIGPYYMFGICGVCTFLGITVIYFVLPNTENKTLQEINVLYQNKTKVDKNKASK